MRKIEVTEYAQTITEKLSKGFFPAMSGLSVMWSVFGNGIDGGYLRDMPCAGAILMGDL